MHVPRRLLQGGLVLLLLIGSILAAAVAWTAERNAAEDRAGDAADRAAAVLRLEVESAELTLGATAGLFDAAGGVSGAEFATFARRTLRSSSLTATGYIEVVDHGDLREFEARRGIRVTAPAGAPAGALSRNADHFVIVHVAPASRGGRNIGVDAGASIERRSALQRAAGTADVAATPPVTIFGSDDRGVVLYAPVYRDGTAPDSSFARRRALRGFIFGGFVLTRLLAPVVEAGGDVPIQVQTGTETLAGPVIADVGAARRVSFGGRYWTVVAQRPATPAGLPLTLLLSGLGVTALAAGLVLTHARRERYARGQVDAATQALRVSRAEYRSLLDHTPDVVARYDRDHRYLYVNPAIEAATGAPPAFFVGKTIAETGAPPDLLATWSTALDAVFATGDPTDLEFTFPSPGGARVFQSHLTPEPGPDGGVASVLVVSRDVTRDRAAEERVRAGEARYRLVVGSMGDGVVVHDADGRVVACNAAAEAILGATEAELTARGPDAGWPTIREDGTPFPRHELPTSVAIRTGRAQDNVVVGVERRDGTRVWLNVSSGLLPVGDPGGGHVVTCFTDITARVLADRERQVLNRVATLVASEATSRAVFELIAREVAPLVGAEAAAVVRFDDPRHGCLVGVWGAEHLETVEPGSTVDLAVPTTLRTVAETGESASAADAAGDARRPAVIVRSRISAAASAPIRVGDRVWGALSVVTTGRRPLAPGAVRTLERLGHLASLAIMSGDAREQLARLASTDHLTGLWNRRAFEDRLSAEIDRARRRGRQLSLVVLDVDHFKLVNDTHGHQAGDRVLVEVAARLMGEVRSGEVVARVGGEEFAWILPETDADGGLAAGERVRAAIAGIPFPVAGRLTASFGVCDLTEARDATELFRLADVALYWAKTQGRNRVFRYSQETLELLPPQEQEVRLERVRTLASVRALAAAVDAKDASTMRHSERVAELAEALALNAGWTPAEASLLREAALVHDVGKIAIPDAILLKDGPLDDSEYAQVTEHARIGAAMLTDVLCPDQVAWVRGHHERYDGRGYPDGLAGDAIPPGARILALADAWDAMTTARPYGAPLTRGAALEECRRMSGTQFAPDVVAALEEVLTEEAVAAGPAVRQSGDGPPS